jgi:F-type H+-transporting ATPase subunit alpha
MRIELAQYRELEAFAQFASDLDEETTRRLNKGARLVEVLKQPHSEPLGFQQQVAVIVAANEGVFDGVSVQDTASVARALLEHLSQEGTILTAIAESRDLSDELKTKLIHACTTFKERTQARVA